jgi:RecA/RadA recombinase
MAKGKGKTDEVSKENEIRKQVVQASIKSIKKVTGKDALNIYEMEKRFGVRDYISTGMPSLDLHLPHNKDRSKYGLPYGRAIEIHGENSSFKTTTLLSIGAKNLEKGGITYSATCEMDYDVKYVEKFILEQGLDPKEVEDSWIIHPVTTVKDFHLFVKGVIDPISAIADELEGRGINPLEHLPRVLITLDSLGALQGDANNKRLDEDIEQGDKMGSFAKEVHDFFQFFLYDFARLGIMFVFTNHYRDNLGYGNKKNIAAHDSAVKFYTSIRLEQKLGYSQDLAKKVTRDKIEFKRGAPLNIKIHKARTEFVMSGEVNLDYYYNYGFDYIGSLIEAGRMTSLIDESAKVYTINLPESDEYYSTLNGKMFGVKDLRKLLKEDLDLCVRLEKLALAKGPNKIEDGR